MNIDERLHPELREVVAGMPRFGSLVADPVAARASLSEFLRSTASILETSDRIEIADESITSPLGGNDLHLRLYTPRTSSALMPAVLWLHGGGFIVGSAADDDALCARFADEVGAVIVSVDYALAPENPYPAALDDCYTALCWVSAESTRLSIDRDRIAVAGASAGGALAAALCLKARDCDGPTIAFQMLIYPVLDDRHLTPSSASINDARLWNREISLQAWRAYLGPASREVSVYAAPARAENLLNLPPACVLVAELDCLRDEAIEYAHRLLRSNVRSELLVVAGAIHAFDVIAPQADLSRQFHRTLVEALRRALLSGPRQNVTACSP